MLVLASWEIKKVTLLGEPRKMSQHIEGPSTSPCGYTAENVPGALQGVVSTREGSLSLAAPDLGPWILGRGSKH